MRNKKWLTIIAFGASCLFYPSSNLAAEEIVKHPVRATRDAFVEGQKPSYTEFLKMLNVDKTFDEFEKDPYKYSRKFSPTYELKTLPSCTISQKREVPVTNAPHVQLSNFNYIFYSVDISGEVKRAKEFGRQAIGYKAGRHKLSSQLNDPRSGWASLSQIKCLPTKVSFESNIFIPDT